MLDVRKMRRWAPGDVRGMTLRSRTLLAPWGVQPGAQHRIMAKVAAACIAAALLAGCGDNDTKTYTRAATLRCMEPRLGVDVRTGPADLDVIASRATNGAFMAEWGTNSLTLVFESSPDAAASVEKQYQPFAEGFGGQVDRDGNVVLAWEKPPTDDQQGVIDGCLS